MKQGKGVGTRSGPCLRSRARAGYGEEVLVNLPRDLRAHFGWGFRRAKRFPMRRHLSHAPTFGHPILLVLCVEKSGYAPG